MSSKYINNERKIYSMYVLQHRAIPHAADGLKAGARRVLWTARDGKKYKSATLAGATMPIHPHASPESTINTIAGPYGNNIPLLKGEGAFGTLLDPTAYAATRYTSVAVSEFTKDVMFRDIEIIPMQENYDGTLTEPKHFLPLIPIALLNPQSGIAVGFASDILPYPLDAIIRSQLSWLDNPHAKYVKMDENTKQGEGILLPHEQTPGFTPTGSYCENAFEDKFGKRRYTFKGTFKKLNATTIRITNLPYGIVHSKFIKDLGKLEERGLIQEITDNSKNVYNIEIRFKKGTLRGKSDEEILKFVGLIHNATQNMNVVDFDGQKILATDYSNMIAQFSDWRLGWYKARYERLAGLLEIDIQRYKDVLIAIKKKVGAVALKTQNRAELKEYLKAIGIVHVDYIADLSVYRFTEEEKKKTELKLADATVLLKEYKGLIRSESKRRDVYIKELKEIRQNYKKGKYDV